MSTSIENVTAKSSSILEMPCVVCDCRTTITEPVWRSFSKPAAICGRCYSNVDRGVIKQLFTLRCQVRHLHEMVACLKEDFEEFQETQ